MPSPKRFETLSPRRRSEFDPVETFRKHFLPNADQNSFEALCSRRESPVELFLEAPCSHLFTLPRENFRSKFLFSCFLKKRFERVSAMKKYITVFENLEEIETPHFLRNFLRDTMFPPKPFETRRSELV
jgi:hypothetical protein